MAEQAEEDWHRPAEDPEAWWNSAGSQAWSDPDAYWNSPMALAAEHAVAHANKTKWKERGPPGPDEGGPDTWRGLPFRKNSRKWMSRGGKHLAYYKAKYGAAAKAKGKGKGKDNAKGGWSSSSSPGKATVKGGGASSSSQDHGPKGGVPKGGGASSSSQGGWAKGGGASPKGYGPKGGGASQGHGR